MLPYDDILTWEGLRRLCDTHVLRDFPTGGLTFCEPIHGSKVWKLPNGRGLRPMGRQYAAFDTRGAVVSTRDAWWHPWREKLKALPGPFVLVTTFHDSQIGDLAVEAMFAEGSPVSAWLGVQVATADPRITAMPIGVKGEMVAYMPLAERRDERDTRLYVNFQQRTEERQALWAQFPWATRSYTPDAPVDYLNALGRSKFVLSPPGRSWDCYRTYEALAMGAIPIVKRQAPLSDVVEGLPVMVVDDWSEVTPERLEWEWNTPREWNLERLSLRYWKERIDMARISKGRKEAYDNIAIGSAISTRECTVPDLSGAKAGVVPPNFTAVGNSENIAVGADYGEERVSAGALLSEIERMTP